MMQKFRMNFRSIVLDYQFSRLRAGFEWPARFFRRTCCFRTSDTRSAKTVPYKHSVCHNSKAASACAPVWSETQICGVRGGEVRLAPDGAASCGYATGLRHMSRRSTNNVTDN